MTLTYLGWSHRAPEKSATSTTLERALRRVADIK
jgi:hypothetical protein